MTDCQRCQRIVESLTETTGIEWTFGYIGNLDGRRDDRRWYAFAAHPGRVGTYADQIGGVSTKDLGKLADRLATVLEFTRVPAVKRKMWGAGDFTDADADELTRLEAAFEEAGGRGVELAERIDQLRAKRDGNPNPEEDS